MTIEKPLVRSKKRWRFLWRFFLFCFLILILMSLLQALDVINASLWIFLNSWLETNSIILFVVRVSVYGSVVFMIYRRLKRSQYITSSERKRSTYKLLGIIVIVELVLVQDLPKLLLL